MTPPLDLRSACDVVLGKLSAAHRALSDAVHRQWNGAAAFLLSIPARPGHDTDLLLSDAMTEAEALIRHLTALSMEVCVCAAVQTEEGLVIRGHRHHDALRAAALAFCTPRAGETGQGFVTSRGRYVDRREGYRLQVAAQIGSAAPGGYRGEVLYSEDLY